MTTGTRTFDGRIWHFAACDLCGFEYDQDGDFGTYYYDNPAEAVWHALNDDLEYLWVQLPDGRIVCYRADQAHDEARASVQPQPAAVEPGHLTTPEPLTDADWAEHDASMARLRETLRPITRT